MDARHYLARLLFDLIDFEQKMTEFSSRTFLTNGTYERYLTSIDVEDAHCDSKAYGMCRLVGHYIARQTNWGDHSDFNDPEYIVAYHWVRQCIMPRTFARSKHYSGERSYPVEGGTSKYHSSNFREKWIEGKYAARRVMLKELIDELQSLFAGE